MPYGAGGEWKPAPGVSYWPRRFPGDEPRPMESRSAAPAAQRFEAPRAAPAATPAAPDSTITGSEWVPSILTGPRVLNVGGSRFTIPRAAQVKTSRRAGVAWVRVGEFTFVLSESGMLNQSALERKATRWDLL